jgi:hypothetical protein
MGGLGEDKALRRLRPLLAAPVAHPRSSAPPPTCTLMLDWPPGACWISIGMGVRPAAPPAARRMLDC